MIHLYISNPIFVNNFRLHLRWPHVFLTCLGCIRDKFAHGMRGDFFQVFGSKTKPTDREKGSRVTGGGEGEWDDRIAGQTNKTALEHMDFPHVNQYSSPDLSVEQ